MGSKFKNLYFGHDNTKTPEFTGEDVRSIELPQTEEKVDYASDDLVGELGRQVNAVEIVNTAFNFKFIPREKIQFNPHNDFEMRDIEELAESILNIGMQHNLGAFYDDERDHYVLESGERRLRACDLLKERFEVSDADRNDKQYIQYAANVKPFFDNGFPVNVKKAKYQDENLEYQQLDHIDSELRKYKVNIDVRELSPQERAEYIQKVKKLMEDRNRILYGADAPSPTKSEIAAAVGTSERQLRKYDALRNLIPALREEFQAGNISINKVPGISALPEEEQMIFLDLLQRGKNIDAAQIKLYKEHMEQSDRARKNAEMEKEEIEAELERIRSSKNDEIAAILEESKKREDIIREQIEKAAREKNEDAIIKLQNDLAKEKESSSRLIVEANRALESTKEALKAANKKLEAYSQNETASENVLQLKAELSAQIILLTQAAEKVVDLIDAYQQVGGELKNKLSDDKNIKIIKDLIQAFR